MMDFCDLLKACYKDGIAPFALYSQMCDLCKGDLKLKEQAQTLYRLYGQVDIFHDISTCATAEAGGQVGVVAYVEKYSPKEQSCLWSVVRLLHPEWTILTDAKSESVQKVQAPKRQPQKPAVNRNAFQNPSPIVLAPTITPQPKATPAPAKQKAKKTAAGKETLHISNMLSELLIQTTATEMDFRIQILQNGVWTEQKKGIGKHGGNVYINLDGIVADQIHLLLPQRKYATLYVDKVHGDLTVEDKADSFGRVSITLESGRLKGELSASKVFVGGRATEIELQYTAHRFGEVEIRNTLGNIRIDLQNVSKMQEKVFAVHGTVRNTHTSTNGKTLLLKAVTNYGDIEIT
jgi:hypothetical protein